MNTLEIKRAGHFASKKDAFCVAEQVLNGWHSTGKRVGEFENYMCSYIGAKFGKATNSGTSALFLSLKALGIGEGDEVIMPTYICQSVLSAVKHTGAKPVPADIDPDVQRNGFNISKNTVKPHLNNATRAIITAHMFGVPANVSLIKTLGVPVIEDCAQALGAAYMGQKVGSRGDLSIFSFYSTKLISTGQGGMVMTSSKRLAERVRDLTTYDGRETYDLSYNLNLTDIQAALGLSQLEQLNFFLGRRGEIWQRYNQALADCSIILPPDVSGAVHHRYVIRTSNESERRDLERKLKQEGIGSDKPVFMPAHRCLGLYPGNYGIAEKIQATALTLPLYPSLTDQQVEHVIAKVREHAP